MAGPITTHELGIISSAKKDKGQCALAEALGWESFDDEADMRKSILLDYLYDHCKFAVDKGFSLKQVNAVVEFAENFLERTKDTTVPKALLTFKDKSDHIAPVLGDRNFKMYSEFLFSTYMRHFQLFKIAFTMDRATNFSSFTHRVETAPETIPFRDGKEVKIWEYEQKIGEMEKRECEFSKERAEKQSRLIEESERMKSELLKDSDITENPPSKEDLEKLVKEVVGQYSEANLKILQASITDVQDSLQMKLQKASVPRPADMGPQSKTGNANKTGGKNTAAVTPKSGDSPRKSAKSKK